MLLTLAPVLVRTFIYWMRCRHLPGLKDVTEYRALKKMALIVLVYFLSTQVVIFASLVLYLYTQSSALQRMHRNDVNGIWWSLFHAVSAFNNAGFSTYPDSLVQWQMSPFVISTIAVAILLGNLAFPILMRLIVWILHHKSTGGPLSS